VETGVFGKQGVFGRQGIFGKQGIFGRIFGSASNMLRFYCYSRSLYEILCDPGKT